MLNLKVNDPLNNNNIILIIIFFIETRLQKYNWHNKNKNFLVNRLASNLILLVISGKKEFKNGYEN